MRRLPTSLVGVLLFSAIQVGVAHGEGGRDGFNDKAESVTNGADSFVATSTAFVDPDGKTHPVDTAGQRAASPYEFRVKRFAGICPDNPMGQPQDLVFVDRRLVSAGPAAPWEIGGGFCASPGAQPIDLGDIAAQAATVTQTLKPPPPTVRVQPAGTTLVANPTVFSGGTPPDLRPPALVNPLSGRSLQLTVRPSTWTWDFGDGSAPVTTSGPPSPHTSGADVSGLFTHTYLRAADVVVTVTVTWTATYTITGVAATQTVAGRVTSQRSLPLRVRQARSQLVSR